MVRTFRRVAPSIPQRTKQITDPITDKTLVNQVRGGNSNAFARLVERYQGMVYGLAFSRLRNAEDARDVAQEAFVTAFVRLNDLRDPARFAPWLRQVTINAGRAWRRRNRPTQELCDDIAAASDQAAGARIETRIVVQAALACLSPQSRQTLSLFYVHENSLAEIAAFLDVPVTTVKSRLRDGRARLRKELSLTMEEILTPKPLPPDFAAQVMRRLSAPGAVRVVAISPDGRLIAHNVEVEDSDGARWGEIRVWEIATGTLVRALRVEWIGRDLLFSPDSARIGRGCAWQINNGGWRSEVRFWEIAHGEIAACYEVSDGVVMDGLAHSAAVSPDGHQIATGSMLWSREGKGRWGEVRLWDAATGKLLWTVRHRECVWAVAFSPDGSRLASSSGTGLNEPDKNGWVGGDVCLWDAATGELLRTLERPHAGNQCTLAFSPDGTRLATGGGGEGDVLVWDTQTGQERRFSGHAREVYAVAFSPNGVLLASGSRDATVRLWDVATGELRSTLSGHGSSVQGVAFTPDGKTLASTDLGPHYPGDATKNNGSVRLWRLR